MGCSMRITTFDDIVDDMAKRRERAIADAFTQQIGKLLRDNGVVPYFEEIEYSEKTDDEFIRHYGVVFDRLDFSGHDAEFLEQIKDLETQLLKASDDINSNTILNKSLNDERKHLKDKICELEKESCKLKEENSKLQRELQESAITDNLPYEPIAVAEMLINAEEIKDQRRDCVLSGGYSLSQLRQIAEHLLVYCNNNEVEG